MPDETSQSPKNIAAPGQVETNEANDGANSTPPAPTDLAEAFAALREADAKAAQGSVADGEPVQGKHAKLPEQPEQQASTEQSEDATTGQEPSEPAPTNESVRQESDAGVGGNAASNEPVDYSPARQQIYQGINQQAMQNVVKRFQDNGIRMWEIADLYDKDEQSGRVTFKNPDDEQRPFQSRKEAQDFVDAMNRQINMKFQSEIRQEQQKLLQEAKPSLSMLDFVPVYQNMSDAERGVFDDLITPYAVRDANGNINGFNCDLNAAANQARAIAARFAQSAQAESAQSEKKEEPTAPAVDMATGTGEVANDEPKDLSEAFAMINKKKKENKNG